MEYMVRRIDCVAVFIVPIDPDFRGQPVTVHPISMPFGRRFNHSFTTHPLA